MRRLPATYPWDRDIIDSDLESADRLGESIASLVTGTSSALLGLSDSTARLVLEARRDEFLRLVGHYDETISGVIDMLANESPICEACGNRGTEDTGCTDEEGVYLCKDCAMSAWLDQNPEPKFEKPPGPFKQALADHVAAAEDWARRRRAFQDSIGVTR